MTCRLSARVERWPVAGAFVIARGAKTHVDVVTVAIAAHGARGRGEATPIYYHGETAESVLAQVESARPAIEAIISRRPREGRGPSLSRVPQSSGMDPSLGPLQSGIVQGTPRWDDEDSFASAAIQLQGSLPRGAARNALDAALWDWAAKRSGTPAWALAGLSAPVPQITAYTISLDTPAAMEAAARVAAHRPLLKLKLAGEGDVDRVAAVRRGAPAARLIVDANEGWTGRDVAAEAARLLPFGVELIEQPVRAGEDALLDGIVSPIPLCADESCQDRADLTRCAGRYAAINVKLDKCGGLTEALALAAEARARGLELMVGCMLATSLGIAPAMLVAQGARWVDLDGALLLAKDRPHPLAYEDGQLAPPAPALWG